MAEIQKLVGDDLVSKAGPVKTVDAVADADVVGIYFSAHWCPPCRGFTPSLAETYTKMKDAGLKFEVIFVSSDRDQGSADGYYADMPWLMVPFENREQKDSLSKKYGVSGIPTLVLVDGKDGSTITQDGRGTIMSNRNGEGFPWK